VAGIVSNGGMTKTGAGTLTLSGASANTFTNLVTVSAGTLNLNKTAGQNAIIGSVTVSSGATLLLSSSNQLDSQTTDVVTLSGGTIKRASGVTEVFGNLNVTEASFLDFSGGTGQSLTFTGLNYTPSAFLSLQLVNFTQGNTLVFQNTTDMTGLIGSGFTFSGSGGFGSTSFSGSTFTITAIPEPSTYLAAAGLLAMFIWPSRRRLIKDMKSILGLRVPARDRFGS
jgi:autotransporter-associated beta strand protein